MSKYIGNFKSERDMLDEFQIPKSALEGVTILLAWYGYGSYDGDAFVLFQKDGKLFEVNGSHCSCYGLEGQWGPEETSIDALLKRKWLDYLSDEEEAGKALREIATQLSLVQA